MSKKTFAQLLAEAEQEKEELKAKPEEAPTDEPDLDLDDEDDDAPPKDPNEVSDDEIKSLPSGKGDYSSEDLREVIDYVTQILDREDDGLLNDSVADVGMELMYEYADALPQSVINQIVDDLKQIFEIEDTLLEAIIAEDAAFIKKKGPASQAAKKAANKHYAKNKKACKSAASDWRQSERGQEIIALHHKIQKKLKKKKGVRLKDPAPAPEEM